MLGTWFILGWLLYIFLTVTIIYVIVVVFHISATSSPLSAFFLSFHCIIYVFRLQPDLYILIENELKGFHIDY